MYFVNDLSYYQDWDYEVHVIDQDKGYNQTFGQLKTLQLRVEGLRPQTLYHFRVRAYSLGGKGPWSETFSGKTLRNGEIPLLVPGSGFFFTSSSALIPYTKFDLGWSIPSHM